MSYAIGWAATHNNALIQSGEARLAGGSRLMLYLGFDISPRSVFWLAYFNGRSDNADVIRLVIRILGLRRNEASKAYEPNTDSPKVWLSTYCHSKFGKF